jgi:hypothetical protein
MALVFFIFGVIMAIITLAFLLEDWNNDIVSTRIVKGLIISIGLLFIAIPFYKNTSSLDRHVVVRTDTYNGMKFDKVMVVEYDIYKGDNWWTWDSMTSSDATNIKVSSE